MSYLSKSQIPYIKPTRQHNICIYRQPGAVFLLSYFTSLLICNTTVNISTFTLHYQSRLCPLLTQFPLVVIDISSNCKRKHLSWHWKYFFSIFAHPPPNPPWLSPYFYFFIFVMKQSFFSFPLYFPTSFHKACFLCRLDHVIPSRSH